MTVMLAIAWIGLGVGLAVGFAMGRWTAAGEFPSDSA